MPLLFGLMGGIASGLAGLLSLMMGYKLALKLAAYTVWIAVTVAFLATTLVCATSTWNMAIAYFSDGSGMSTVKGAIAIGLGVIIPSTAAVNLSCCASVWIAAQVYRMQKQGLIHFGS